MSKHDIARARLGEAEEMQLPRLSVTIVDAVVVCQIWFCLMKLEPQAPRPYVTSVQHTVLYQHSV